MFVGQYLGGFAHRLDKRHPLLATQFCDGLHLGLNLGGVRLIGTGLLPEFLLGLFDFPLSRELAQQRLPLNDIERRLLLGR